VPFQELHRKVTSIALRAAGQYGFALGGGNALMEYGIVDRLTQDVDLFTNNETIVPVAAGTVEDALRAEGYLPERQDKDNGLDDIFDGMQDGLAEWIVTAPSGDQMMLQLAYFDRTHDPVDLGDGIGPVLAIEDVIAGKTAALAARSYVRDYIDMAQILRTYLVVQVIALARQLDPGLEDADFADAGLRLDELDDAAFARYGLTPTDVAALRGQFATWPRTAPPRTGADPEPG
jgi:hypothetical protein